MFGEAKNQMLGVWVVTKLCREHDFIAARSRNCRLPWRAKGLSADPPRSGARIALGVRLELESAQRGARGARVSARPIDYDMYSTRTSPSVAGAPTGW